jgi:hypothetical protein
MSNPSGRVRCVRHRYGTVGCRCGRERPAEPGGEGGRIRPAVLLPVGVASLRGIALAELNGDGLLDVVLTDQTNARVFVFFSEP